VTGGGPNSFNGGNRYDVGAYSFYLQYNIYTAENPLEHVVPVASHHHRVLHLRVSEYVCPSGRQRAAFIRNPAAYYVTSHT